MEDMSVTKQKVYNAAIALFNTKGFTGTSVREIAKSANVNVALISYYFKGKKGLLEQLMIHFFENYIAILSAVYEKCDIFPAKMCLREMVKGVLKFQSENHQLARLVYREVTVDTILIREIMTTYLTKERFIIETIIERGIRNHEFRKLPAMFTITQLKGMLMMPYLQPQYMKEVLHLNHAEPYFVMKYTNEIDRWIEDVLCYENNMIEYIPQAAT